MDYVLLFAGLIGLWLSTELTVRHSIRLAKHFDVSDMFIGMTIVAFGTDLPELMIAINGSIDNLQGSDSSGLIIGNTIGSSIAQTSLVLGISAVLFFIRKNRETRPLALQFIGAGALLIILTLDRDLSRPDGIILLSAFLAYLIFSYRQSSVPEEVEEEEETGSVWKSFLLIVLGLAAVLGSSELAVDKGMAIAGQLGVGQSFVGAILMGIGTSLPELAISLQALIRHDNPQLSIGNIIGSSIFDLLVPLGAAAVISALSFDSIILYFDLPVLLFTSLLVLFIMERKGGARRKEGVLLIAVFLIYALGKFFLGGGGFGGG